VIGRVARVAAGSVALVGALLPGVAGAQPLLHAGTKEIGIAGGVSISHESNREDVQSVTGYRLLVPLGYVLTDETGPGILRGNVEVLLEPTLLHLTGDEDSATLGGAAALVRWIFRGTGTVRPYLEAGAGVLGGRTDFRQSRCDVNFLLEGGPGVLVFVGDSVAVAAGYRLQHMSNADLCSSNLGLNSSLFHVGVSYFFP
jgi:hypothetical protein